VNALIQNNQGMACQLIAIAYGTGERYNKKRIHCLDVAGAITAVKAIWATLCSGGPMKTYGINENYRQFRGDREARYRSFVSQPLPGVVHYHVVPDPRPESESFVITSLTSPSREEALYHVLRLYSPHPVLPGWGDALFELGLSRDYGLLTRLDVAGLEWAYCMESIGWDTLIDQALKAGRITVPEEHDG
jgi:hypothetical protein